MKLTGLSLQQAPPISVPFRFFLTAPLFGVGSALLSIWMQTGQTISRWNPETLALTHSFLLGFVTTVMLGAQMQLLPVLAGSTINQPKRTGWLVHSLWTLGSILLISAFISSQPLLFRVAAATLAIAIAVFAFSAGLALLKSRAKIPSILGMKLALAALLITVTWGVILALGHTGQVSLRRPSGTDIHAMWGLLGWISLLIIAVAYQVVPLFQITNTFPKPLTRRLAPGFFGLLALRMGISFFNQGAALAASTLLIVDLLISSALVIFALVTLHLQHHRRRNIGESHQRFWSLACVGLLATITCWWATLFADSPALKEQLKFFCAALYITTFITPVIVGMLYKITAFLLWFHLQAINTQRTMTGGAPINVPHMKGFIPETRIKIQLYALATAQALTILTPAAPKILGTLAGVIWLTHFSILAFNLYSASLKYWRLSKTPRHQQAENRQ